MARKPNYDQEKRRKEQDRKARKEAKRAERQARREQGEDPDIAESPAPTDDAPGDRG
jgi:hypothetical protein